MADIELTIGELLLDDHNPRHRPVDGQTEALAALLRRDSAKILELANDIISWGGMNPMDRLMVLKSDGGYIALEGNRRVAALKLIDDPSVCSDPSLRAKFEALRAKGAAPKRVQCVSVASREEARHWRDLRHAGEMNGAGVVRWSAIQRTRNAGAPRPQERAALATIDWLEAKSAAGANKSLADLLDAVAEDKFTTIGRLATDPDFRAYTGFDLDGDRLTATDAEDMVLSRLVLMLEDFRAGMTVSELHSKEDRLAYISGLRNRLLGADATEIDEEIDIAENAGDSNGVESDQGQQAGHASNGGTAGAAGDIADESSTTSDATTTKKKTAARPRPSRLFHGLNLPNGSKRLRDILGEVQKLDLTKFPNSSAALIRMLIELTVNEAFDACEWQRPQKDQLKHLIQEAINQLDPSGKDKQYLDLRRQVSDANSLIGTTTLNAFLHRPNFFPTATEMRDISDKYQGFLEQLDAAIAATR